MPEGHEYADDYYDFSRPDAGIKSKVDTLRDSLIRKQVTKRVRSGKLLDVGCGIGMFLETMTDSFDIYGQDISEFAIEKCQERLPGAKLALGSLSDGIEFEETFDVITAINVFEHLEDPMVAADVVRRHLRPGGLLVAHLPTIGNAVQARLYRGSYDQDPTHVYRPSGGEFVRLVEGAGFRAGWSSYAPFFGSVLLKRLPIHPAFMAVFEATRPVSQNR